MNKDVHLNQGEAQADLPPPGVRKGKLDLVILRYMARRVYVALRSLDQVATTARPLLYYLDERRRRTHRMAIYNPEELLLNNELAFVGFISARQKLLRPSIIQAIQRADKRLVEELAGAPGVLSYSSLEVRNGDWCNLVLLSDAGAKTHIKGSEMHKYAAYHLAHSYYEWIRLHNGVMPEGLDHMEMQLQKTKYYTFQAGQPWAFQHPSRRGLQKFICLIET